MSSFRRLLSCFVLATVLVGSSTSLAQPPRDEATRPNVSVEASIQRSLRARIRDARLAVAMPTVLAGIGIGVVALAFARLPPMVDCSGESSAACDSIDGRRPLAVLAGGALVGVGIGLIPRRAVALRRLNRERDAARLQLSIDPPAGVGGVGTRVLFGVSGTF